MARPCGYYPSDSHQGVWVEDLELPAEAVTAVRQRFGSLAGLESVERTGAGIRSIVGRMQSWSDTGLNESFLGRYASLEDKYAALALLGEEGYQPYLPLLGPAEGASGLAQMIVHTALQYLLPTSEQHYQEYATRWLVRQRLMDAAYLMTGEGTDEIVDTWYPHLPYPEAYQVAQRQAVEAAMPVICSLWPYFVVIDQAEKTQSPYVNWAAVSAGPIRLQGRGQHGGLTPEERRALPAWRKLLPKVGAWAMDVEADGGALPAELEPLFAAGKDWSKLSDGEVAALVRWYQRTAPGNY